MSNLFPDFLETPEQYDRAAAHWMKSWNELHVIDRAAGGWIAPWFAPDLNFRDGNPIFSAVSHRLRRGIRIIQHAPTSDDAEFQFWLDTFGDPDSDECIDELVIALALTDATAELAGAAMGDWIAGRPVAAPAILFATTD